MDRAPRHSPREADLSDGDADPSRVSAMLRAIANISSERPPGVTRLGFTRLERDAHALFATWMADMGLRTWQDAAGNTVAELAGTREVPAIGVGSHLDSVPNGGRYDGIVGMVGAAEMIRTLLEREARLVHPIRVVAFSCEEGARFGQACIGSHAVAGSLDSARLDRLHDASGVTLSAAMTSVGLDPSRLPSARWVAAEWAAFLELHVEQGRVLEAHDTPIGIVDSVSGSTRLLVHITGRADHSGGTPMDDRADALAAAAELVLVAEAIARDPYHRGMRITVGRLSTMPNSVTTIAGQTVMSVDIRDVDADRQRSTANEFGRIAERLAERRGVEVSFEVIGDTSPVVLPRWLRDHVVETCRTADIPYRVMVSGASHDSQVVNQVVPAAIVFVPSRGGLSHVPEEWTSTTDIARGVDVLRQTVMRLDSVL
jgi:allantoate deiminase